MPRPLRRCATLPDGGWSGWRCVVADLSIVLRAPVKLCCLRAGHTVLQEKPCVVLRETTNWPLPAVKRMRGGCRL